MALHRLWASGLLRRRFGRVAGAAIGVALATALVAALFEFIGGAARSMTSRAVESVPVDWQVQFAYGADADAAMDAVRRATPISVMLPVLYADVAGFTATVDGTTQTTGAGKAVGLPAGYDAALPGQIRLLLGSLSGPLLAQQTAANLHATVGSKVTIDRPGVGPADVIVAGIVDLPNQDSMFQAVGLPSGAQPQAPPDNVVLLPAGDWRTLFDQQASANPGSARLQLHVRLDRASLPSDPVSAFADVLGRAKNLEARIAGSGLIADNLAARLDATRSDALYARVLFLFLGAPGVAIAVLLTLAVAGAGQERRRHEQALLRARGADTALLVSLTAVEALLIGLTGVAVGLAIAAMTARAIANLGMLEPAPAALAALAGLSLALAAALTPAWRTAHEQTVAAARTVVGRSPASLWRRLWLDIALIIAGAVAFWYSAASSYQVVLAPEGVAQAAVDYPAFLAPVCLWLGAGLLATRSLGVWLACSQALRAGRLGWLAARLAPLVPSVLARRRRALARAVALTALAVGFAVSTAVFNTTYNAQSRIDAELTNGADVAAVGVSGRPAGQRLVELTRLPGVAAAEPMMHRFAYVGSDLQDLFGIDPRAIGRATIMSDAFFGGGSSARTLAALSATRDGLLVSEETVSDFQLQPGDSLNLRLQSAADHQYYVVPFRFVGVAREFPTAPRDSFLVANADYIAEKTDDTTAEIVLMRASGDPETVAAAARKAFADAPGVRVTSVGETQRLISSSLTAIDLRGLTTLELTFAIAAVIASAGLLFGLDVAERRRGFAVLALLGAKRNEIAAFLWSEALFVVGAGLAAGAAIGLVVAYVLVMELEGVFDPPPEGLSMPWPYLVTLVVTALVSVAAVVCIAARAFDKRRVEALRDF
jgi:putative ABC transport system permease protein